MNGLKKYLWIFFKYGLSLFCLVWAFRGVPLAALWRVLRGYPLPPMGAVVGVAFVAYFLMGLRLSRMSSPPLRVRSTFCATLVGLALNNVLPAKAGEIAKAVWIERGNGITFEKSLGIVFMERFFDVNVLAALSLWFLWSRGDRRTAALFVVCLALGWALLVLFRRRPALEERFTSLFGRGRLREFVARVMDGVISNMEPRRLAWLVVMSFAVWICYGLQMLFGLNWVAGFDFPLRGVVGVFAISSLGMLLPSSPGAVGVYEAVTVAALDFYGVPKDAALGFALFAHMAQFIPVTVAGVLLFLAFPANAGNSAPDDHNV